MDGGVAMSYMTIIPPNRGGVQEGGSGGGGGSERPPGWLVQKYKRFLPSYSYSNGFQPVDLEKVRWWPDTLEWVGVYYARTYAGESEYGRRDIERYVWVWRAGRMVQLKQFGVPHSWRSSREDWSR